jgi:hypothetical protein
MAGGTETLPSNDPSNEPWSQRKDFGLKKKHFQASARQVRGEVCLDGADVVIDGMWDSGPVSDKPTFQELDRPEEQDTLQTSGMTFSLLIL